MHMHRYRDTYVYMLIDQKEIYTYILIYIYTLLYDEIWDDCFLFSTVFLKYFRTLEIEAWEELFEETNGWLKRKNKIYYHALSATISRTNSLLHSICFVRSPLRWADFCIRWFLSAYCERAFPTVFSKKCWFCRRCCLQSTACARRWSILSIITDTWWV